MVTDEMRARMRTTVAFLHAFRRVQDEAVRRFGVAGAGDILLQEIKTSDILANSSSVSVRVTCRARTVLIPNDKIRWEDITAVGSSVAA
ncbi:hypothetical protein K8R03_03830 [Candidatus Kaiserbacteria bacterium]|nr:hypothetical protein [Candidatus Kaiserbacteria bacterium]